MTKIINLEELYEDQLIDCRVASMLLGLSLRTVRDMASRRELPLYKIRGRVFFEVKDIIAYRNQYRVSVKRAV